ncbi:MAG: ATP-binding protein [Micromonosporaceae bacterium]
MATRDAPRVADPGSDEDPALDLPFSGRASLAGMRYAVARHGAGLGLTGERLDAMVVIAHELAANAVVHGGGRGRLRLWSGDDAVYCQISDEGPGMSSAHPPIAAPPAAFECGRGIFFVHQLADSVDISTDPTGTVVTACVGLPGRPPSAS